MNGEFLLSAAYDGVIRLWKSDGSSNISGQLHQASPKTLTLPKKPNVKGFNSDASYDNGWIKSDKSNLICWVPHWYLHGLIWPSNVALIGAVPVQVDFDRFVQGPEWTKCCTYASSKART